MGQMDQERVQLLGVTLGLDGLLTATCIRPGPQTKVDRQQETYYKFLGIYFEHSQCSEARLLM